MSCQLFQFSHIARYLVHRNANFNAKTIKISEDLRAELSEFLMHLVLLCTLRHTGESKIELSNSQSKGTESNKLSG